MDTSLTTNTLQPNGGGLQDGQTNLQPQSQDTNTQSTGALQQDALGPNAFRSFDGLTVQGAPFRTDSQATIGKGTPEIFWGIFVLVAVFAVIVFALYKRKSLENQPSAEQDAVATSVLTATSVEAQAEATPKPASTKKKQTAKPTKKAAAKKVVKKKTTAAKRKKKK